MLLSAPIKAVDVPIRITGTINIPPCEISGGNPIQVSFGKMLLSEVDGYKNAQTKTIEISCKSYHGVPYIKVEGGALFGADDNVLDTTGVNSSVLGIALYQGSDVNPLFPLKIGKGEKGMYGYKILRGLTGLNTEKGQFTFTAVPYKKAGSVVLKAGGFTASATMSINYL